MIHSKRLIGYPEPGYHKHQKVEGQNLEHGSKTIELVEQCGTYALKVGFTFCKFCLSMVEKR